ncbi:MAG: aminoglycoside phosphotransferase family protein [Bacteroidetes bacterium]|nr:MAG: aminoglycoside phosphotransferase family protein [Bacteroidota bacterium]
MLNVFDVKNVLIEKAADQFLQTERREIAPIGHGLIHHTYKVSNLSGQSILLQQVNRDVFLRPENILHNYDAIYNHLSKKGMDRMIPRPLKTREGQLFWIDEEQGFWRANEFRENSFSPDIASDEKAAWTVARIFAGFTQALEGLDLKKLQSIIPHFHDLSYRYSRMEDGIGTASMDRLLKSTHVIAELRQRIKLVDFFESIRDNTGYPDKVMHHDAKISNILFDKKTGSVICPVDLDTVMPGKFFSDLGDMIRSMACTVDENSTAWEEIEIRPTYYRTIVDGYLEGIGNSFTDLEKTNIHFAGLIMIYMQALRFLTDFLESDKYYKTSYPEQNLNRALNQLILLEKMEEFLKREYSFSY